MASFVLYSRYKKVNHVKKINTTQSVKNLENLGKIHLKGERGEYRLLEGLQC